MALFCTDGTWCLLRLRAFRYRKSTIEFNVWNEQNTNINLPNAILELYINDRFRLPMVSMSAEKSFCLIPKLWRRPFEIAQDLIEVLQESIDLAS